MDFANLCEWFVDNKLSIHPGESKTKFIRFTVKVNIKYNEIEIKQYSKKTYLDCLLDETMSRVNI